MIYEKLFFSKNILRKYNQILKRTDLVCSIGYVRSIVGNLIRSNGPDTTLGDFCNIIKSNDTHILAEVIGFDNNEVLLAPLGNISKVKPGSRVVATGKAFYGYINEELLGRCIDAMCRPLDGMPKVISDDISFVEEQPPTLLDRPLITKPFYTGIRAIDSFLTLGKGQRIGIFSGSGVGKSTLLGMIARFAHADVNVIALIGERSREVNEFIINELGEHGIKKSVLVVASSNESPMHKIKATYLATRIAEFFRDKGKDVLLLVDSLTRFAMAQREIGLVAGEPATTKGYPPSVYSMIPNLLERAGTSVAGSITGIYTVLVEADDMNEPVSDMVRGVLDGHIVLDRSLANKTHFPAIDISSSISRLMSKVSSEEDQQIASSLRELLSVYQENEEIITMGAYTHGSNPLLDKGIQIKTNLDSFLRQGVQEYTSVDESRQGLKIIYDAIQHGSQNFRQTG